MDTCLSGFSLMILGKVLAQAAPHSLVWLHGVRGKDVRLIRELLLLMVHFCYYRQKFWFICFLHTDAFILGTNYHVDQRVISKNHFY